jgi:hypothetical protein
MISFFFAGKILYPSNNQNTGLQMVIRIFFGKNGPMSPLPCLDKKVLECHQHVAGTLNFSPFLSYLDPNLAKPSLGAHQPTYLRNLGKKDTDHDEWCN